MEAHHGASRFGSVNRSSFISYLCDNCQSQAIIKYTDTFECTRDSVPICVCLQQMDNAVYTFEQILHQSLESQGGEDLCKTIQRCQDRVIKVKHVISKNLLDHHFLLNQKHMEEEDWGGRFEGWWLDSLHFTTSI